MFFDFPQMLLLMGFLENFPCVYSLGHEAGTYSITQGAAITHYVPETPVAGALPSEGKPRQGRVRSHPVFTSEWVSRTTSWASRGQFKIRSRKCEGILGFFKKAYKVRRLGKQIVSLCLWCPASCPGSALHSCKWVWSYFTKPLPQNLTKGPPGMRC